MSTVRLGDAVFDLVATQDARLSVEGTSGGGKSNTLAVILEDLADVNLPTLIIERLGSLTPVRLEDENIVVVGGQQKDHVDLAVPLEDLGRIGRWVLDDGMKVLLDVSTYEDYESEKSRVHLAAFEAIRSLNDRAEEKYKDGDRTKSLLAIDEAHIMAPKDNAPEPELDEHVRRCRGQIIKAATEGGNKGISLVVAYQRRAFLHNGVIQLCADWVVHALEADDAERAAKKLNISREEIGELSPGEAIIKGTNITDGQVVRTQVRKRTSPDPREDSFSLPDTPPEVSSVVERIQDEVADLQDERSEKEGEIERLRRRLEEKNAEIEDLEEQLAEDDRLVRLLQRKRGGSDGEVSEEMQEEVNRLRERVETLRADKEDLEGIVGEYEETVSGMHEEIADLEAHIAELEAMQEARDEIEASARSILEAIGRDDPEAHGGTQNEQALRDRIEELEREKARLVDPDEVEGAVSVPTDDSDFLRDSTVQEQIDAAKQDDRTTPRYVKTMLSTMLHADGAVGRDEVAEALGISNKSHVSSAAGALESRKVIKAEQDGREKKWTFNHGGIEEIKRSAKKREEIEETAEML